MNRNALESLRLGELVEATQVRLIGASDGFDSSNQQSKIMLAMMNSFARGPPADWRELVQVRFRPGNLSGTDRRTARDRHPQPLTGSHATVPTARETSGFKAGSSRREIRP
jgi:hypothetical protein